MGKRSSFPKFDKDLYRTTDKRAFPPLVPFLLGHTDYAEPCCGKGDLIDGLRIAKPSLVCVAQDDIMYGKDALSWTEDDLRGSGLIITNPPWSRANLHPLIEHFVSICPESWLLIDAPWMFTQQAKPYLRFCSTIVPIGRLKWFPETKKSSMDDCAWFCFVPNNTCAPYFVSL